MKIFSFNFPIFVKDLTLSNNYINTVKKKSLKKYDFNKNNFFDENDINFLFITNKEIQTYLLEILKQLKCKQYKIQNTWIQKYDNNDFHDCHIHDPNGFSFVLYIDCTEDSSETMFYNVGYPYFSTKTYKVKPKLGRCVVFHGAIPHTALPNKDDKRLIVSGNIKFY
jgi:hypothetical protein